MPIKQGSKDLHVGIDAEVERALSVYIASKGGQTKGEVVEAAIAAYIQGETESKLLATLHARLDTLSQTLETLTREVAQVHGQQLQNNKSIETLTRAFDTFKGTLGNVADAMNASVNGQKRGFFGR